MQPLVWGFEPLMDINGIQVVLHAFTWFVTYLFAGCILMERQAELESAILSMARRCVDQLRYWRIMEHRTCAAQAYSTLEVLWTAAVPTMHIKTQFYVALSLSYRAMYGCARRNQTSDPRLRMQRELLYVPLKFWLGGSLTMVVQGRVELL